MFNLQQAFTLALNQIRKEYEDARQEAKQDRFDPVKKAIFLTYRSVLERLDSLL